MKPHVTASVFRPIAVAMACLGIAAAVSANSLSPTQPADQATEPGLAKLAAPLYQITALLPQSTPSDAVAINRCGDVLLSVYDKNAALRNAFGLLRAGRFRRNDLLFAYGLNDSGAMSGINAVVTPDGREHDIAYAYFTGVNNHGDFVGTTSAELSQRGRRDIPPYHAVLGHGRVVRDLGVLTGYQDSHADAINDAGVIVGTCSRQSAAVGRNPKARKTVTTVCPCIWESGHWRQLGTRVFRDDTKYGDFGVRMRINKFGQVVMDHIDDSGDHCIVWSAGKITPIGPIKPWAINDAGQVVGETPGPNQRGVRAVLWTNGRLLDLNAQIAPKSGWTLEEAHGVNASGQIVGKGELHGNEHAFLLTPIPGGSSSHSAADASIAFSN